MVAGNGVDEGEKGWAGATVEPKEEQPEHDKPSERKTGEDEAKEVVKEDVANKDATEKDATDKDAIEENAAEENATEESATTIATEKTATEKGAIEEDSNLAGPKTAIPMDGEIRVGLTVARESSPARRARDLSQHRKSERVVVEQVIVGN